MGEIGQSHPPFGQRWGRKSQITLEGILSLNWSGRNDPWGDGCDRGTGEVKKNKNKKRKEEKKPIIQGITTSSRHGEGEKR